MDCFSFFGTMLIMPKYNPSLNIFGYKIDVLYFLLHCFIFLIALVLEPDSIILCACYMSHTI